MGDLTAERSGGAVELHFTAPAMSTDGLSLRGQLLRGTLCRQVQRQSCLVVQGLSLTAGQAQPVELRDELPESLQSGAAELLSYRVELFGPEGSSAGASGPAWTVAGAPPPPVHGLQAQGSRLGVVLRWAPAVAPGTVVLLERVEPGAQAADRHPKPKAGLTAKPRKSGAGATATRAEPAAVWLQASAGTDAVGGGAADSTLDTTVSLQTPYRYTAVRQRTVQLEGHRLTLRSAPSAPVAVTVEPVYPPPVPTGLVAAGVRSDEHAGAVDLIWEPVDTAGLLVPLAGYNVYRQPLDAGLQPTGPELRLTTKPVPLPAFHDATAPMGQASLYTVRAVDEQGNQSGAVSVQFVPDRP